MYVKPRQGHDADGQRLTVDAGLSARAARGLREIEPSRPTAQYRPVNALLELIVQLNFKNWGTAPKSIL